VNVIVSHTFWRACITDDYCLKKKIIRALSFRPHLFPSWETPRATGQDIIHRSFPAFDTLLWSGSSSKQLCLCSANQQPPVGVAHDAAVKVWVWVRVWVRMWVWVQVRVRGVGCTWDIHKGQRYSKVDKWLSLIYQNKGGSCCLV
jgi:hypothetical protein